MYKGLKNTHQALKKKKELGEPTGHQNQSGEDREKHEIRVKNARAKSVIDQALGYLVSRVYSDLDLIQRFTESEEELIAILNGDQTMLAGTDPNRDAAAKVEKYLEIQFQQNLPTTMSDLQERFQKKPFGWREIDIAAVTAMLIHDQKVTVKYGGTTIRPGDPGLPGMLRKKSEIGKISISIRQVVSVQKIREAREFLRDYFDEMDVPEDEDGLVAHIVEKFTDELNHYTNLESRYEGHQYPDLQKVKGAITFTKDILSQQKDNIALIRRLIDQEDNLYDMKDGMQEVEEFFRTRVALFDTAVKYAQDLRVDQDYLSGDPEAERALKEIQVITMITPGKRYPYNRIPELNELMAKVKASHEAMLENKRQELLEIMRQCMAEYHPLAIDHPELKNVSDTADRYYDQQKEKIEKYRTLALLDGLIPPMWQYKYTILARMESMIKPSKPPVTSPGGGDDPEPPKPKKEVIKPVHRQTMFPAKTLKSEEEIDAYLERIRANMKKILQNCDGIRLK